ncbi:MAG: MmgE/PrpD family protein [Pseudolabrys sp.]
MAVNTAAEKSAKEGEQHTAQLADFITGMTADNVPTSALRRAAELVVDHLAVSLHGLELPWSKIMAGYVEDEGGRPDATLYGAGRVPARMAALANGTIGHGIELDDTHDQSLNHPGAVVIPAALAVAEMTNASGRDLLTAIVAGYEAQTRAGASLNGDLILRGFHPTALGGVFGSSTAWRICCICQASNCSRLGASRCRWRRARCNSRKIRKAPWSSACMPDGRRITASWRRNCRRAASAARSARWTASMASFMSSARSRKNGVSPKTSAPPGRSKTSA